MNEDLKPCPFCGGKAVLAKDPGDITEIFAVYCLCCKALVKWNIDVKKSDTYAKTQKQWEEKWNRRANDGETS